MAGDAALSRRPGRGQQEKSAGDVRLRGRVSWIHLAYFISQSTLQSKLLDVRIGTGSVRATATAAIESLKEQAFGHRDLSPYAKKPTDITLWATLDLDLIVMSKKRLASSRSTLHVLQLPVAPSESV